MRKYTNAKTDVRNFTERSSTGRESEREREKLINIIREINFIPVSARHKFRRLLLPMLIVLKLFKLKLLLFLPLILGLASFKKFLGLLAIVIPGLIGFFKFYKPYQNYYPPVYTKNGIGHPHYGAYPEAGYHEDHASHYANAESYGQDLAYRGYQHYDS